MRTLGHVVTFFALIYYENAGPVRIVLLFVLIIIFHSLFRWLFLSQILHVIFFLPFFFCMSFFACHFSSISFLFIFFNNNFNYIEIQIIRK